MKRLVLGFVLLVACAVAGLWSLWPTLTDLVRQRVEGLLTDVLRQPSRVEGLAISLLPPHLQAAGVVLGKEPTIALQIGTIDMWLWPMRSLLEGRPVVSARVRSIRIDLERLALPESQDASKRKNGIGLPSLHLSAVELEDAELHFPLRHADAALHVARLTGEFASRALTHEVRVVAEVEDARLARRGTERRVSRTHLEAGVDPRGIFLQTAIVQGDGIEVTAAATAAGRGCSFSAAVDLGRWSVLVDEAVQGEVRVTGQATGDLANPLAEGEVTVAGLAVGQRVVGELRARVFRRDDRVGVTDVELTGPIGYATASAVVQTGGRFPIEGSVDLQALDVDALIHALGSDIEMGHRIAAAGKVSGTLAPLALTVSANADVAMPSAGEARQSGSSRPLATVEAVAKVEDGAGALHIELMQPEQNRLSGKLAWKNAQLEGTVDAHVREWRGLNELLPKPIRRLRFTGQMEGTASIAGPAASPRLQASVTGKDMTVNGVAVSHCAGTAQIVDATLTTPSIRIETPRGSAELQGTMALGDAPSNNWRIETRNIDSDLVVAIVEAITTTTIPVSGGGVDATVNVRGPWARAAIDGKLLLQSAYLAGEPIERAEAQLTTELPQWSGHASIVRTGSERVSIEASGNGDRTMQLALESTPWRLETLRGAGRRQLGGSVRAHATITGSPLRPSGRLTLTASGVALGGRDLGDVTIEALGREGEWTLSGGGFGKAVDLNATLRMLADFPYTLAVRLHSLDFARFASTDDSLRTAISAEIDLHGALKMWAKPSGTVRVPLLQVRRGDYEVKVEEPIRIDVTEGRLVITPFVLVAPSSQLRLGGEMASSGEVDFQAQGGGNLVLLEVLGRPIHSARGQFNVAVKVRREPATGWDLSGQAEVSAAAVDLGLPLAFTDINGRVALRGSRIEIVSLDAKAGGGGVRLTGTLSLDDGPRLGWEFHEVALSTSQGLEAQVSGAGQVEGEWKAITVSGTVEVLNALYDRNLELTAFLPFFREQMLPAPRTKPATRQVFLDIRVRALGGMHIDNNVAEVELAARLRLAGTVDAPDVTGTVEFVGGEVKFKQRVFTITGGSIDFRGGGTINPVLNITAEAQISTAEADYTVTVSVSGTAEKPRIQLAADDPTLSETDILSLITFGQTVAQLQRQGGGVSAIDAVALLPTGRVTDPLANALGVNRLEVEAVQSQASGTTGTIEPRVTIGKDLTDRLRTSVATTFGAGTQPMVLLEYRVTRRISLLGSWEGHTSEQAGAFGGAIKFRYEFRQLPFSLMPGGGATASPHAQ